MALAKQIYTGSGIAGPYGYGDFADTFVQGIAESAQLGVYVDGVKQTLDTHYTVDAEDDEVTFEPGFEPATGTSIVLVRETKIDSQYVTYSDNSILDDSVLNQDSDQMFNLIQENSDRLDDAMLKEPGGTFWAGQGLEIRNGSAGTTSNSFVTVSQLNSAIAGVPSVTLGDGYVWTFDGNGSTTSFSLTGSPAALDNVNQLFVSVSGVVQRPGTDFTLTAGSPATLVFTSAPPTGTGNILVQIVTGDIVGVTIPDGSIGTADIADDAVTIDKLDFDAGVSGRFMQVDVSGNPVLVQLTTGVLTNFDASVEAKRLDQFANPDNDLDMDGSKITDLGTGTASSNDACTVAQMESHVTSQISGIGSTRVASGSVGANGSGTGTLSSLSFQPDVVIATVVKSSTGYTRNFTSSRPTYTDISVTVTPTANGFTFSGVDGSSTITYTALKDS